MNNSLGSRIRKLREKKGLTQAELARRVNLGESTISFYELDKREPNYEILLKIADVLETTPNYLLTGDLYYLKKKDVDMNFSKRLMELRKEFGLTQEELAKKVGVTRGAIGMYEIGQRDPDFETLQKLSDIFNVSIDYLLGKTNIRNSADEITEALKVQPDLLEFWNELKNRPDLQLLFKQTKNLSPKAIRQVIQIIKIIEDEEAATI